jgi:parallel beta-helix repeat protein
VVAGSPEGSTFTFAPGIYRNLEIVPKDDQVFLARPGAVLNGSVVVTSFLREGAFWILTNRPPKGQFRGTCDTGHPRCMCPQDLFVDERPLRHVESRNAVISGTWFYDFPNRTIYLKDDPAGHKVELSVSRTAFSGPAVNVTIDGFVVEKYANEAQVGAIGELNAGAGWIIRNNQVRLNHGVGITFASFATVSRNYTHHNGHLGIATAETSRVHVRRAVIEKNEVAFNNWAGFDPGWAAGGIKVCSADDLVIRDNSVHDNAGKGIWADIDSSGVLYENNVVTNNRGAGIVHEISDGAIVRNNRIAGNSIPGPSWYWGAQILIQNAQNVDAYGNTLEVPPDGHGIIIVQQNRGPQYPARNNHIHGNIVVYAGDASRSGMASDFDSDNALWRQDNVFDYNTYRMKDPSGRHWVWNDLKTSSQLKAMGQEKHGVVRGLDQ